MNAGRRANEGESWRGKQNSRFCGPYLERHLSAVSCGTSKLDDCLHMSNSFFDIRVDELFFGRREHQIMHT